MRSSCLSASGNHHPTGCCACAQEVSLEDVERLMDDSKEAKEYEDKCACDRHSLLGCCRACRLAWEPPAQTPQISALWGTARCCCSRVGAV